MPTPYDDPTRAFERELRRAEAERRRLVTLAGLAGVAIVGLVVIMATVLSVRGAATTKPEPQKRIELAEETKPEKPAPLEDPPEKTAPAKKPAATPAPKPGPEPTPKPAPKPAVQRLSVGLGQYGYDPETLNAKAGIPIKLTVAQGEGCAAGFLMPGLEVSADNSKGPAVIDLPALEPGSYQFMCAMQMVSGMLVVK